MGRLISVRLGLCRAVAVWWGFRAVPQYQPIGGWWHWVWHCRIVSSWLPELPALDAPAYVGERTVVVARGGMIDGKNDL